MRRPMFSIVCLLLLVACNFSSPKNEGNGKDKDYEKNKHNSNEKTIQRPKIAIKQIEKKKSIVLKKFNAAETFPYFKDEKWGYANKAGEIVIEAVFDKCSFFKDGFAWVAKDGKYGFINEKGDLVIECQYDEARPVMDGFFPVKKNSFWGFVDSLNDLRITYQYEDFNWKGNGYIHVKQNKQWGIVDTTGKQVCPPLYDWDFEFENEKAIVSRKYEKGVIDNKGQELVKCIYGQTRLINDTMFLVRKDISYEKKRYGIVATNERTILQTEYSKIRHIPRHGLILEKGGKAGLLNLKFDTLIAFNYEKLHYGTTDVLAAKNNGRYGYITLKNDTLLDFIYDYATPFVGDIALVENNGSALIINVNGDAVYTFPNGRRNNIDIINENLIRYRPSYHKVSFVSRQGDKIEETTYNCHDYHTESDDYGPDLSMEFGSFVNGYAIVGNEQGQVGMIDATGKLVIPMKYHHLEPMNEYGFTVGSFWNKKTLIDKNGKQLTGFKYEDIRFDKRQEHFAVYQKIQKKNEDYYRENERIVGYLGYDGTFYGDRTYDSEELISENEIVDMIRQSYKRIQKESPEEEHTRRSFEANLWGDFCLDKFTVKDKEKNIRYEYYYNENINSEGPCFIYIVSKEDENRYYYYQGRIIRWVDKNKKHRQVANAMYAPEHDAHQTARGHLIWFENEEAMSNEANNDQEKKIDELCEKIDLDILNDKYKKGDSEIETMGEYQRINETYLDSKGNLMYSKESATDEGGHEETVNYYLHGDIIRSYYSSSSHHSEEQGEQRTSYYTDEEEFRIRRFNGGFEEIIDIIDTSEKNRLSD